MIQRSVWEIELSGLIAGSNKWEKGKLCADLWHAGQGYFGLIETSWRILSVFNPFKLVLSSGPQRAHKAQLKFPVFFPVMPPWPRFHRMQVSSKGCLVICAFIPDRWESQIRTISLTSIWYLLTPSACSQYVKVFNTVKQISFNIYHMSWQVR